MIILDIETTGTDPRYHSIISIGALEFENPTNQFYSEGAIWEGATIDPDSLPIHGFSEADITSPTKESQYVLMKSFIEWIDTTLDHTPAGLYVAGFDLVFLQLAADRENLNWPLGRRSVDLHSVMYTFLQLNDPALYTTKNHRSGLHGNFIQKYCGLDPVGHPHNALDDTKWEAECFSRILFGQSLLPEFANKAIPPALIKRYTK